MSDLRKAAEMALEVFEHLSKGESPAITKGELVYEIAALRQALAQPEQEPFIYLREDNKRPFGGYEHCSEVDAGAFPVYTAPPKREWVGLTDEDFYGQSEIQALAMKYAESKLKEKNNG